MDSVCTCSSTRHPQIDWEAIVWVLFRIVSMAIEARSAV